MTDLVHHRLLMPPPLWLSLLALSACSDSVGTGAGGGGGSSTAHASQTGASGGNGSTTASTSDASAAESSTSVSGTSVSGTSASTDASSAASGGSSSSGGVVEDCHGSADEDGDGLVDCADPDCTSVACVTTPPADWTGYFALYQGDPGIDPGCPANTTPAFVGLTGLLVFASSCSACSCGAATGVQCGVASVYVSDQSCAVAQSNPTCGQSAALVSNGSCSNSGAIPGGQTNCGVPAGGLCPGGNLACNASVIAAAPVVSGGTCAPSGGTAVVPASQWLLFGRACLLDATPAGGCNAGTECVEGSPGAPYEGGVCISHAGDMSCPVGYPHKHLFAQDVDDTRGCSACTCDAPSGGTCSPLVSLYSDASCGNVDVTLQAGSCKALAGNPTIAGARVTNTAVTGASCAPSGGAPTGTVTPIDETTFCCR